MTNDIVKKPSALPPALVNKIADGLARSYGGSSGGITHGEMLLKLDKGGTGWGVGMNSQSMEPVEEGSRWFVNSQTFKWGWVVWSESKKVYESMIDAWLDAPEPPPTPHPTGQPYKFQSSVEMRCLDGADAGLDVLYPTSADGGNERLGELRRIAGARIRDYYETTPYLYPVVTLDQDYYDNKRHGNRTYKPVFHIVGWANIDGEMEDNVVPLEKPAKPAAKAAPVAKPPAQPAPAAQAEPAQGQRRRPGR